MIRTFLENHLLSGSFLASWVIILSFLIAPAARLPPAGLQTLDKEFGLLKAATNCGINGLRRKGIRRVGELATGKAPVALEFLLGVAEYETSRGWQESGDVIFKHALPVL